jgi:hypothetical protein
MNLLKSCLLGCVLTLSVLAVPAIQANSYSHRQYYSRWTKHPYKNYYSRSYYYKPSPTYTSYKHHYVIYYPQRPKYVYYYNPYSKQYWGRVLAQHGGKAQYQLLAKNDRKSNLQDIPESAFPKAGPMPAIPESTDGGRIALPPQDLPKDEALSK